MILNYLKKINLAEVLLWAFPVLLIVPNICLCFTEQWSALAKATGVALPFGLYLLVSACTKKVGRTVLWCIPLMIYCAFQIVLLYLYGESIIAIDMFINVFTTNPGEVAELLGNLLIAIFTVLILYLPLIVCGIIAVKKKIEATDNSLRKVRIAGTVFTAFGFVSVILSYACVPGYKAERQLFPVNVIYNSAAAVNRTIFIAEYHTTSRNFTYYAYSTRDTLPREVYVMVIGETSRAGNWQLAGYDRHTNPMLSSRPGVIFFNHAVTESNTTHKSVPMIMSYLDADTFGDSIYSTKGIFTAFNEAGFSTAFISNQMRNRSFIEFFGNEADTVEYISDGSGPQFDGELLPLLRQVITDHPNDKLMIVLHTYGSHFNYKERYPREDAFFLPDDHSEASVDNRDELINAYDNTIRYTDKFLDSVISTLDSLDCPTALLYLSDHGEDIFDDERHRFLHASPSPTFRQVHVPMMLWTSPAHRLLYPELSNLAALRANEQISSTTSAFPTMLSIAGVDSPYRQAVHDLTDSLFRATPRRYVTDYNEGVSLGESGLRRPDIEQFTAAGISYK